MLVTRRTISRFLAVISSGSANRLRTGSLSASPRINSAWPRKWQALFALGEHVPVNDERPLVPSEALWQFDCLEFLPRNKKHVKTDWHFTTADARVKLKRLYPAI
jgi:hypothetical protein